MIQTGEHEYFQVFYGEDGKWLATYRVTNTLEKAKAFADDWVAERTGPGEADVLRYGI